MNPLKVLPRMSDDKYRVLILDDDQALGDLLKEYLQNTGICVVTYVTEESDFWKCLSQSSFDIVFLDYKLPGITGLDILARMGQAGLTIPTVMMTGEGSEHVAARAIQSGALDYLVKGEYSFTVLPSLIQKAVRLREMQREMQQYLDQIRYQAMLLDNVRDAVVVWDPENTITYWNAAAEELYGLPAAAQIGQPIAEVYLPLFDPPIQLPDLQPGSHQIERRIRTPEGTRVWISAHITPLFAGEDPQTPSGSMNVARDITARKKAEEKLQKSEARYRAIVEEHQTEMICRFYPDGQLTFVNNAFCQNYSVSRDQITGTSFLAPMLDDERSHLISKIDTLSAALPVIHFERRVQFGSDELRWEEWAARAIFDRKPAVVEVQAVGRDITERKLMEAQIQAAQTHLTQTARLSSIGALASSVAHQISNPLTTIIAEAQILSHSLGREHPSSESADAIMQAGWRAQSVINELMRFSQPDQVGQSPVPVSETIQSALLLASEHIQSSGVRLETKLDRDLPLIRANASQLTDLWVNLLLLARASFTAGDDRVIQIRAQQPEPSQIVVHITDNGNPIPPAEYDTIFEPKLIPTGAGRGTGMELSLCREIVRQNKGQISISGDGKETTFSIFFPVEGT